MSLTLLGGITGLLGSLAPQVVDFFKSKEEKKKELETLRLEIEAKEKGVDLDIRLLRAKQEFEEQTRLLEHDIALGQTGGILGGFRALVRPIITYSFLVFWVFFKIALLKEGIEAGNTIEELQSVVWDEETAGIFSLILSFWFGSRAMERFKK